MRAALALCAPLIIGVVVVLQGAGPRLPLGLDLYRPVPEANPLTSEKIVLGRQLFRDRRLSRDGSLSCSSCHDPGRAFTDGRVVARGIGGARGERNVPTIVNRAWGTSFFWDGRAATLEQQVVQPILHPDELAMTPESVLALVRSARYRSRFEAAFGLEVRLKPDTTTVMAATTVTATTVSNTPVTPDAERALDLVSRALASYVRTIVSGDSPYDRFVAGDRTALSGAARRGLTLFRGRANCSACHVGPTFTDEQFHNTGVAWRTGAVTDQGRASVSKQAEDRGAFKTPTLREVSRTAPYMHDGGIGTLDEVVDYYDRGGQRNPGLDPKLRPLRLSPSDKQDVVAFLLSLTGTIRDGQ